VGSTKEDQTARRKAIQDVIAANRPLFEERMRHHYDALGLGEWKPRLTPEERAANKAEEARLKAAEKIRALAEANGLAVAIDHFPAEDPGVAETTEVQQAAEDEATVPEHH